eukprot:scaffold33287_cov32-Tisochrysis_lutea.AAC.1
MGESCCPQGICTERRDRVDGASLARARGRFCKWTASTVRPSSAEVVVASGTRVARICLRIPPPSLSWTGWQEAALNWREVPQGARAKRIWLDPSVHPRHQPFWR